MELDLGLIGAGLVFISFLGLAVETIRRKDKDKGLVWVFVSGAVWVLFAAYQMMLLDLRTEQLAEERAQRYELQTELKACRDTNDAR
jgi:hypothetical protein